MRQRRWFIALGWIFLWCGLCVGRPALAQDNGSIGGCPPLSLYCMELTPRSEFAEVKGRVELARPPSAFGVAVTRDGRQRFLLVVEVSGLPDPSSVGPYDQYVLWAMPLTLDPMINMGSITNGQQELKEISFNKFMLLVTAEPAGTPSERSGPIVMRGRSPSARLEPHDMFQISAFADPADMPGHDMPGRDMPDRNMPGRDMPAHDMPAHDMQPPGSVEADARPALNGHDHDRAINGEGAQSNRPAMHPTAMMMDAMMTLKPSEPGWLPAYNADAPAARPREVLNLADGDSITLHAFPVIKTVAGKEFAMLGYNGQIPGPLIAVNQNVTVVVTFINDAPFASSIHWHGLRQDNAFDGVPGLTQDPVPPGGSFVYEVNFPDAGIYWYHPHHREEAQQELGLYGNMLVRAPDHAFLPPVDHEEVLVLDDFQIGPDGAVPFGAKETNFALMGRFGTTLLINGEERPSFTARAGESTRWFVTNVSNTRVWNISIDGLALEIMGTDLGPFESPIWEENMTIAPAERYIADIRPLQPGRFAITNRIQSLDHTRGLFFPEIDTLGWLIVEPADASIPSAANAAQRSVSSATATASTSAQEEVRVSVTRYASYEEAEPDKEIELLLRSEGLPILTEWVLRSDQSFFLPVEFSDTMPYMNWSSTGNEVEWVIREPSTGRENVDIEWQFALDSVEKIRITNRRDSQHAMQHPIHVHGQRFLVLSYNGRPVENRAWKDTILIPAGMTADILVEFTNPGSWMLHCHIAEHLETGMKMAFIVE